MSRRKRIRKIEKWARNNPPLLPAERQALPKARVTLCEAVTWLATGKACSGKVLRQMPLSDDIPDDVQTGQKIELAGRHLWDAFGDNDLPMFGYRANDYGKPSVEIEQIPSEKSFSRRTTTAPLMGVVDDTISIGRTTYEGVTMRRSDLLRLWPASTPAEIRIDKEAFDHVLAAAVGPEAPTVKTQVEAAKLRGELKTWIEESTRVKGAGRLIKADFLQRAREEVDPRITKHLFNEVWRTAEIPADFRKAGAPPKRV